MSEKVKQIPQFLIAGASSGSGKTTISVALMRLFSKRGLRVAAFKCGPDYIDPQFHELACGTPSINLDLFMSSEKGVKELYASKTCHADGAIVEGVMGMYDGYEKWKGSSGHLARLLGIPVVLIVNGSSVAYSVGALIKGFQNFLEGMELGGVIFNNVSSENHFKFLKEACDDLGVTCFGYVKKSEELKMPSRHLGLRISDRKEMEDFIDRCASSVSKGVDVDLIIQTLKRHKHNSYNHETLNSHPEKFRVAVARDEAFSFIYDANLDALKNHSRYKIELQFFSPLNDSVMPECDFLYLPGGYPELYAERLAENQSMKKSVKEYCGGGGRVLAECGGMIYLCESLDGTKFCDVLPMRATMKDAKLHLGYRKIVLDGMILRGHEFHYSRLLDDKKLPTVGKQYSARGKEVSTEIYRQKNVIAGYTHLYWAENDLLKLWNL